MTQIDTPEGWRRRRSGAPGEPRLAARSWRSAVAVVCALVALTAIVLPTFARADSDSPATTMTVRELPPPDLVAVAAAQQADYVIGPLDTLVIKVYPEADLGGQVQVDASGKIDLPLINEVSAAGKTPRQLAAEIASKLGSTYLESPSVAVDVQTSVTERYTVTGAVAKPGIYDIVGHITLMQAIATAEGVSEFANERNVIIFRTVQRRRAAAVVNLSDVLKGKVDDPQIYPGDVVVVATSSSKRVLHEIIGATPLLLLLQPFGL